MQRHELEIPSLIKEEEAAKLLQMSPRNLVRLRNKGSIPYYRIGRSVRYSREKLLAALEVAAEVNYAYP
jgi:excisionase family DNA binding protein